MSIVNFDKVKITTMTAIAILEGDTIIEAAFPLLPITKLNLNDISRNTKKFKIPWPGEKYAGAIFSAKYSGINRGIMKTSTNKSFRNSISIDICTSVKNISAKLSKNKIQMTGPNSKKLAREAAQHVVQHILDIQKELDHISTHLKERDEAIRWFIRETKGEDFLINEETQEIIELEESETIKNSVIYDKYGKVKYNYREIGFKWEPGDNVNPDNVIVNKYGQPYFRSLTKREKKDGVTEYPIMQINDKINIKGEGNRIPTDERGNKINKVCRIPLKAIPVTSVKIPDCVLKSLEEDGKICFPKHINARIGKFIVKYIQDYAYHHIFIDFLENLRNLNRIYHPVENKLSNGLIDKQPLSIGNINIAMINYSYSLNMNVDRWKLAELINEYEGFHARYNNTVDHAVTITLPYEKDENETIKRKGQTIVSWMVYKSGIVTQSGPSPDVMKPMYYKFMKFIENFRNQISIKDGKPFGIKFTPMTLAQ